MYSKTLVLFVILNFSLIGYALAEPGGESGQVTPKQNISTEAPKVQPAVNVGNKICPVSGEKIGVNNMPPATFEYEGKIYHFCCSGCIEEFKKDPQKYIAIINEELKSKPTK